MKSSLKAVIVLLMVATAAFGSDVTGTVTNKTSNKPASGDDVVLLALSQGMNEAGRTKTDASGKFAFKNVDNGSPYLIRVIHQGVTYHAQLPPGRSSADLDVYDAAKKIDNLSATVQVMRIQGDGKTLQVTELYAVNNASNPPKTLMSDETFSIHLPDGAQVDGGEAVSGKNGMPVASAPVPSKEKGRYFFIFPLRPGETRFQINYHLPYIGEVALNEKALYPMEHFVVMLPKQMQFTAVNPSQFQSMGADQGDPGATTMVSTSLKPGDTLAFKVSGSGTFPAENDQQSAEAGGGAPDNRPGGGLGPPSEAPDPLHKYRWYILSALAVAMAAGAFYVLSRRPEVPEQADATVPTPVPAGSRPPRAAAPAASHSVGASSNGRSGMLLEALKEELFQLEVDRQEGRISEVDYAKVKAALDVTIGRAIKRGSPAVKTQKV